MMKVPGAGRVLIVEGDARPFGPPSVTTVSAHSVSTAAPKAVFTIPLRPIIPSPFLNLSDKPKVDSAQPGRHRRRTSAFLRRVVHLIRPTGAIGETRSLELMRAPDPPTPRTFVLAAPDRRVVTLWTGNRRFLHPLSPHA